MEPGGIQPNSSDRSTIERFFSGLSECIFQSKLGVADVQLVDYLSDMLLRFVRVDSIHKVRRPNGRPATEDFQMLSEAEKRIGLARPVHIAQRPRVTIRMMLCPLVIVDDCFK